MRPLWAVLMLQLALMAPAMAQPAQPRPVLNWGDIHIYQAELLDEVFPDENELSAYTRRLKNASNVVLSGMLHQAGVSGIIFVAVKPGGQSRVWLLSDDVVSPDLRASLERQLSAIPAVEVRGAFLFGLSFGAWGADPYETGARPPPIPPEWEAQVPPGGVMLDDAFINQVWPTD